MRPHASPSQIEAALRRSLSVLCNSHAMPAPALLLLGHAVHPMPLPVCALRLHALPWPFLALAIHTSPCHCCALIFPSLPLPFLPFSPQHCVSTPCLGLSSLLISLPLPSVPTLLRPALPSPYTASHVSAIAPLVTPSPLPCPAAHYFSVPSRCPSFLPVAFSAFALRIASPQIHATPLRFRSGLCGAFPSPLWSIHVLAMADPLSALLRLCHADPSGALPFRLYSSRRLTMPKLFVSGHNISTALPSSLCDSPPWHIDTLQCRRLASPFSALP